MSALLRHLGAVLALPGVMAGLIPALLRRAAPAPPASWGLRLLGGGLMAVGGGLFAWTLALFARRGGALAPWDPPDRLVVAGPYRHVRNPMITGVILVLAGQAAWFASALTAAWAAAFALGNAVYQPLREEPGLEERFGEEYRRYRRHVPRWVPRLRPWQEPEGAGKEKG